MNREIDKLIWDHLDESNSPETREMIKQRLEIDPAYKQRFESLRKLDYTIKKMELDRPSMRFSINVMDQLRTTKRSLGKVLSFSRSSKWYLLSIAASLAAVIGFPFAYPGAIMDYSGSTKVANYLSNGASSFDSSLFFIVAICLFFLFILDGGLRRYYKSRLTSPI